MDRGCEKALKGRDVGKCRVGLQGVRGELRPQCWKSTAFDRQARLTGLPTRATRRPLAFRMRDMADRPTHLSR